MVGISNESDVYLDEQYFIEDFMRMLEPRKTVIYLLDAEKIFGASNKVTLRFGEKRSKISDHWDGLHPSLSLKHVLQFFELFLQG